MNLKHEMFPFNVDKLVFHISIKGSLQRIQADDVCFSSKVTGGQVDTGVQRWPLSRDCLRAAVDDLIKF